jgi:hypothetical protein
MVVVVVVMMVVVAMVAAVTADDDYVATALYFVYINISLKIFTNVGTP